jgi:hypothetical protein
VRSKWSLGSVGGKEGLECDAVVLFIYLKIHDKITKKPVFNNNNNIVANKKDTHRRRRARIEERR